MSQVTVGHGGSVTSKPAVQVVCPVVTQSLGQSTAGTDATTVVVTEYLPQANEPAATSTEAPVPLTVPGSYPGVVGLVVNVRRSPLLTEAELVASTQVGTGIGGQLLRLPIEKKPTNPFPPSDLNVCGVWPNSGLMMKKFGWNFPAAPTFFDCVQKIEPAGTHCTCATSTGNVMSSSLLRKAR